MHYAQQEYSVRLQWGLPAVQHLSGRAAHCVIVDVLSFSTSVDIACGNGAEVLPYRFKAAGAVDFACENKAMLAAERSHSQPSLSPGSLCDLKAGSRLVLPSQNGAALSLASESASTLAGCLRNAAAVADYIEQAGGDVLLVAAGELGPDGRLRFAYEDFIGAGAIIQRLRVSKSPEALAAEAAFELARPDLERHLQGAASGAELVARGFPDDVTLAAQLNISACAPVLLDGAYRAGRELAAA
ncbi:2-phosphosulfolactate phosphatase [Chromobacterium phragmitis]|uniref:Probable 2-phosphosulfolactate phosphatase n=1 Tax=Chromobacterium phragmitis TaxID=2202141 RepID=A0A344UJV1_9NEIS|nr:2-phosphosulfolactate phosphatase [Chromobacterium phragmitis]AXE30154.1 2-phosphosulfolactate phosphatase [Chromobacterium phragmitis]AXE35549.1 2-phosphosulfolactate phosphatase [Chromobacterium phragmitis]